MSHCFFDRALDLAQNARPDSATRHPTFDRPYRYGSGYVVNIEICPGVAFDTIRDTVDVKPVYLPVPVSSYLFTDDSTYRIDMEGYHVKARSIEVYPRTVTQTVVERIEVSGKPKRWGIRVSAGGAITSHGIQPYIGIGVQYHLIYF